jgi:elongation factor G
VRSDPETDQIVLAGMGELHIEIIKERIRREYKIDVDLGPLQIAYKETIQDAVKDTQEVEHKVGQTKHKVIVTISLIPNYEGEKKLLLDRSPDNASNIDRIHPRVMNAIKNGVNAALLHGVKLNCPVVNVGVKLHWLETAHGTSDTIVSAAVSQCIQKVSLHPKYNIINIKNIIYINSEILRVNIILFHVKCILLYFACMYHRYRLRFFSYISK